jgi:leucine-rich repeat protein SHOC2
MINIDMQVLIDRAIQDRETHLDLYQQQLTLLPEGIVDITSLVSLRASDNQLTSLPENIGKLANLRELRLYKNQLSSLPNSIANLNRLVFISLSFNKFNVFPDIITNLIDLKELRLNGNQIGILPESILRLKNLTSIDLSGNPISDLSILQYLPNLTHVRFLGVNLAREYWCDLTKSNFVVRSSQDSISDPKLPTAKRSSLNLRKRNLIKLSDAIDIYQWCQHLKISHNYLTSLPENIGNLSKLCTLNLQNNQLTSLPDSIGNLTNLVSLDLRRNKLTELPDSIGNLTNLKYLYLDDNLLEKLPKTIGNLKKLEYLDVISNRLSSFPVELGDCERLSHLDARVNQIFKLESSIGKLSNLVDLCLFRNQLSCLPDEIGNLVSLTSLTVSKNNITELPTTIKNLDRLILLEVCNTVTDVSILQELPRLKTVHWINTNIPREYWTKVSESKSEWFFGEHNVEIQRRLIRKMWYGVICEDIKSQMLNTWRKYALLKIDNINKFDNSDNRQFANKQMILLKINCSIPEHMHVLEVPSEISSVKEAITWINNDVHPK